MKLLVPLRQVIFLCQIAEAGEGGFEGKRIVHRRSGTEIPFTSQVMQDTFLDVLQQTFCDKDQTLQDLEEKDYWKGSKRPLSSTSNDLPCGCNGPQA